MNISKILSDFQHYDGHYKRRQIDAAIKQKAEIIPELIKILEQVCADPDHYINDIRYYAHIYALMLLGHFREHQSHAVILDLFSLPDDQPYDLFGDLVTENLPTILVRTCGVSVEGIKRLITNKSADEYCRNSAIQAMSYAVNVLCSH